MFSPLDILSIETWILLFSVFGLLWWYIHRRWQVLKKLNIPHDPPTILGFGNLGNLIKNPDSFLTEDVGLMKKYGRLYGSYQGLEARITIADPEILRHVFIKESGAFADRQGSLVKINGKELNTALTSASGEQWKRIRTTLSPTFSSSKLKDMYPLIEEHVDILVKNIEKCVKENDGRFDAKDFLGKLSMDVICSSAFGVNVHSLSQDTESEVVKKSKELMTQNFFGVSTFLFMIFPWLEPIAEKLNYSIFDEKILKYYRRLIDTIIKSKKESKDSGRADIMQSMLKVEVSEEEVKKEGIKGMTRTEIVGNALVMLLAGYDTTANAMIVLAYCIAVYPHVQEKLYSEIEDSIKEHGGITYEGINTMKYLDMCFKESLRRFGPVPKNSRYTEVDVDIKGIHIPAGTHVDIPVHALHLDEEYWNDPYEFIPERFEDMGKIDPMVFQPFGAGPRNCIGMRLAILEIKMAMCKMLHNFELTRCDDTHPPPLQLTIRASVQPKGDIFLKATPRNSKVTAK